jgi:rubrerythrin
VAKEEGFSEIAAAFTMIARAEKEHEARYQKLWSNVQNQKVFKKDQSVRWRCRNCGYIHEGTDAPAKCPACLEGRENFEVAAENY